MPHYIQLGKIPHKRHTQFRKPDGKLYAEEVFGTEGFASNASILYHLYSPTQMLRADDPIDVAPKPASQNVMRHRSFEGFKIKPEKTYLESRKVILFNDDIHMTLAAPETGLEGNEFYKNANADEIIFVHKGSGVLKTQFGNLKFGYGDYLIIPRGTIYQISFDDKDNRLLIFDAYSSVRFPKRYMSPFGQFLENSPFCERDLRVPELAAPIDQKGEFVINVRKTNLLYPYTYAKHPFDVVGWDGCEYPFAFNIQDFEPITGRIHQPPPVHQTFEGNNFVICSFCPRKYDYHPLSIPAPYFHSNIDSDEVLYYVDGEFMSRKHVDKGQITIHPGGVPHGPQPGTIERSIGVEETKELAVMMDAFRPLKMTDYALGIEDQDYIHSWLED